MLLILVFALLGACCASPVTTTCSDVAILKPITEFNSKVEELRSPHVYTEEKIEEIWKHVHEIQDHYEAVNETCGSENVDALKKLSKFVEDTNVINVFEISFLGLADSTEVVKEKFESFSSKHIRHYVIAHIYSLVEKFDMIIKATELMTDKNLINEMYEGMIYSLNDTNIESGKAFVPLMKEFITQTNDEETLTYAKSNLKKLVKRSVHSYSDALVLLNEIDGKMAEETVQEYIEHTFTNSVASKAFSAVNYIPTVHLKALALKALNEKVHSKNLENSLVSTKVYVLSKDIVRHADNVDKEDAEILNDIVENATKFSKNLVYGYSCRSIKDEHVEHSEYLVNIFTEHPNQIGAVLKQDEAGTLLKINLETEDQADNLKYSLSLENDDYPVVNLPVTSMHRYTFVSKTNEELCGLNPQPVYNICIPTLKVLNYSHDEEKSIRKQSYEALKNFKKPCNTE